MSTPLKDLVQQGLIILWDWRFPLIYHYSSTLQLLLVVFVLTISHQRIQGCICVLLQIIYLPPKLRSTRLATSFSHRDNCDYKIVSCLQEEQYILRWLVQYFGVILLIIFLLKILNLPDLTFFNINSFILFLQFLEHFGSDLTLALYVMTIRGVWLVQCKEHDWSLWHGSPH